MTDDVKIRTHHGLDGIEDLVGAVVVIDVFRASNTIISLLGAGAKGVFLLADIEKARSLKIRNPKRPLLGERGGITPGDFDGGNSPANAGSLIAPGASPILTTSAGTQAIARLKAADTIIFASFANATAVAGALRAQRPTSVTLLPMGLEARKPALEDDEAAAWITGLIEGRSQDFIGVRKRLVDCEGAARLRRLGQDDDLAFCTELDTRNLVPVVVPGDPPRAISWVD